MDSSVIVIIVMTALAVGLLVWLEVHSRRKKRNEVGQESPEVTVEATTETARDG